MADENNAPAAAGEPTEGTAAAKQKTPRRKKTAAATIPAAPKAAPAKTQGTKRKIYNESEKADLLKAISAQIAEGKGPLREVVKGAGISMQTYYLWQRHEKPVAKKNEKPAASKVAKGSSGGHELAELVQLEAENQRLRLLLAEKLRAENLELRKRLGMN